MGTEEYERLDLNGEILDRFNCLEDIQKFINENQKFEVFREVDLLSISRELLEVINEKRYKRINFSCPTIDDVISHILGSEEYFDDEYYEIEEEYIDCITILEFVRELNSYLRDNISLNRKNYS